MFLLEFEPLLSWGFWLIPQDWCATDPSLVYPSTMTTECYDEQLSDKCMTLLLGTWYDLTPTIENLKHRAGFTFRFLELACNTNSLTNRSDYLHLEDTHMQPYHLLLLVTMWGRFTCLSHVRLSWQEDEWDALHCNQALSGHHDSLRLSTLLPVPPAALLHDRKNGEMYIETKTKHLSQTWENIS